jgi:hypothetical protein
MRILPRPVADKTELDSLVAYLQGLGVANEPPSAPTKGDAP